MPLISCGRSGFSRESFTAFNEKMERKIEKSGTQKIRKNLFLPL
jgi:hypothetical protein